jgi:hypothetical protein
MEAENKRLRQLLKDVVKTFPSAWDMRALILNAMSNDSEFNDEIIPEDDIA